MRYFIIGLLSFSAFAQVKVHLTDPNQSQETFGDKYQVTTKEVKSPRLPSKQERDSLLQNVKEVKDWDELDKDIFVLNLKNKTLLNLSKTYPTIPTKTLKDLKDKLEK